MITYLNKAVLFQTFLFMWCINIAKSQNMNRLDSLDFYGDVMTNACIDKHRTTSATIFYNIFQELITESSALNVLDSSKWISVKSPENQSFKIYTWQVKTSPTTFEYYGFVRTKEGNIYPLNNMWNIREDVRFEELNNETWCGAYYYDIMEIKDASIPTGKYFLLFGLNKGNGLESTRIIDVLYWDKNGDLVFGHDVFNISSKDEKQEWQKRLIITYASDASINLSYNPGLNMIVTDHLVPRKSRIDNASLVLVPDGTYEGFALKDAKWHKVNIIENQKMDKAPRPNPILDKRKGKNIMGN